MRLLACRVLVGSLALVAPQQEQEPSIADELEALIAKTNALESFHLVYTGSGHKEEDATLEAHLELAYRAPWEASITLQTPDNGMETRSSPERVCIREGIGGQGEWRWCAMPDSLVRQSLDELFPQDGKRLERGIALKLGGGDGFQLSFSFGFSGRDAVLGWLARMQHDPEHVSRAGQELVWSAGVLQLRVSRVTGFPDSIVISKGDTELEFELSVTEVDGDVGSFVALPAEATNQGEDEELGASLRAMIAPGLMREAGFMRLEKKLASRKREWDAGTRADWESFLRVLHTQMLGDLSEMLLIMRKGIARNAALARSRLEQQDTADTREAIRKALDDYGKELDEGWAKAVKRYEGTLPEMHSNTVEPRQELFDVEREVIERLHEELIFAPIHAYLDEQREAVLGK